MSGTWWRWPGAKHLMKLCMCRLWSQVRAHGLLQHYVQLRSTLLAEQIYLHQDWKKGQPLSASEGAKVYAAAS